MKYFIKETKNNKTKNKTMPLRLLFNNIMLWSLKDSLTELKYDFFFLFFLVFNKV